MSICIALECKNTSLTPNVSFYSFPTDQKYCRKWKTKLKQSKNLSCNINEHSCSIRLCSDHFKDEDFIKSDDDRKVRELKVSAVPSVFKRKSAALDERTAISGTQDTGANQLGQDPGAYKKAKREDNPSSSLTCEEETFLQSSITIKEEPLEDLGAENTESNPSSQIETSELNTYKPLSPLAERDLEIIKLKKQVSRQSLEILNLKSEIKCQQNKIINLTNDLEKQRRDDIIKVNLISLSKTHGRELSLENIINQPDLLYYYTGFDKSKPLLTFINIIIPNPNICPVRHSDHVIDSTMSAQNQLFFVLVKLRQNICNFDLAFRFGISHSVAGQIFTSWVTHLYNHLGSLNVWPGRIEIFKNTPVKVALHYPKTVLILEVLKLDTVNHENKQQHVKLVIGSSPDGRIIYKSQFSNNVVNSNTALFQTCGVFDILKDKIKSGHINEGDYIMVGKGLDIHKEVKNLGLNLYEFQFPSRVDVGNFNSKNGIFKLKRFKILKVDDSKYNSITPYIDQLFTVCCMIANFDGTINYP